MELARVSAGVRRTSSSRRAATPTSAGNYSRDPWGTPTIDLGWTTRGQFSILRLLSGRTRQDRKSHHREQRRWIWLRVAVALP
jgi:hypothetical protein